MSGLRVAGHRDATRSASRCATTTSTTASSAPIQRALLSTTRKDHRAGSAGGPFAEARVRWTPWLRTTVGCAAIIFTAPGDERQAAELRHRAGVARAPSRILFGPFDKTDFYINAGYGFHSNDRGATITVDPDDGRRRCSACSRWCARRASTSACAPAIACLNRSLAVFASTSTPSWCSPATPAPPRRAARAGAPASNGQLLSDLAAGDVDADLAYTRPLHRLRSGRRPHPRRAGMVAAAASRSTDRCFGGLRLRYFGPRPLIEDDSVRSHSSLFQRPRRLPIRQRSRPATRRAQPVQRKDEPDRILLSDALPGERSTASQTVMSIRRSRWRCA